MYTLYTRPGSGGFVVEAALAMADAPFRQIDVPKKDPPDPAFLAVSPLNQVPALTLPDGCSLTESAAICILLAERHPQAGLSPEAGSPGRADFLRWMAFMSSVLYPAILRLYYAHRYTASADGVQAVKRRLSPRWIAALPLSTTRLPAETGWRAKNCRSPTSTSSCWRPGIPIPRGHAWRGRTSNGCGANCASTN